MYWLVDLVVEDGGLVVFGGLFVDRYVSTFKPQGQTTLPVVEILSGKNARACVSMVSYFEK